MTSWYKKLRAVSVAGLVGACGGAVLGTGIWLIDQLGNTTSGTGLVSQVVGASALAGVAGILFAVGLIVYGGLSGADRLTRHASMTLGALAAPLAYVVLALAAGNSFAGWGVADWGLILALTSAPGSWIGALIFDRTADSRAVESLGQTAGRSHPRRHLVPEPAPHAEASRPGGPVDAAGGSREGAVRLVPHPPDE